MTYEMDDIRQHCVALFYPGRHKEEGGHLSSQGLCIEQGARVVRMDKKKGGWGGQRGGSPSDKTRDGLMTLEADGESQLLWRCLQDLHPGAEVEGLSEEKKKEIKKNHFMNYLQR